MKLTRKGATALAFQDTQFDIIDRNGQPWLRVSQIGRALGYGKRNRQPEGSPKGIPQTDAPFDQSEAEKHVRKLYERHAAEFTDSMTQVVKLRTKGGMQEVRIFSLRGAHLLGMFARTERAAEFRRWVLDILERETAPTAALPAPTPDITGQLLQYGCAPRSTRFSREIHSTINSRAWSMAHEAYEIIREHIARNIAYKCERGDPTMLNESAALEIINATTLNQALTQKYHDALEDAMRSALIQEKFARENVAEIRAALVTKQIIQK